MNLINKKLYISNIAFISLILSSCGGKPEIAPTPTGPAAMSPTQPITIPNTTPTSTPKPTSTPTPGYPVVNMDVFEVLGTRGYTTNPGGDHKVVYEGIATDNLLRIKPTASAPGTVSNAGYQIAFKCVRFSITVGRTTKSVLVSSTGSDITSGTCSGALANPELIFDTEAAVPGHGLLTVSLETQTYDNCNQYCYADPANNNFKMCGDPYFYNQVGLYQQSGCPLNLVAPQHHIHGTMSIYVNGPGID